MSQSGDAAAAHLQRGNDVVDGGADLGGVQRAVGEVGHEDERDLGLHPGLEHGVDRERGAVAVGHVVEQDAEVGLVDAQLLLHRRRGEPDLAAHHRGPGGEALVGVAALDRVGGLQVVAADEVPDRQAGLPGRGCRVQAVGGLNDAAWDRGSVGCQVGGVSGLGHVVHRGGGAAGVPTARVPVTRTASPW